jgi:hypothetical protein
MTNSVRETEMREVTELNAKNNLLRVMYSLADSELTRITDELSSKETELARIVAELEAIRSSTTWRIAAPLRWVRKRIGQWR